MNIQHSTRSDSWYTPKWLIDKVVQVLGPIDFDPASCVEANLTVQAKHFLSKDSLETEWLGGSLFLNPPGGKVGNKSQACLFWQKLMVHRQRSDFTHGIFMAFSAEALQNTQNKKCPPLADFPFCIPAKRIRFEGHAGKQAPSHSNVIAYIPGTLDYTSEFLQCFHDVGIMCRSFQDIICE